LIVAPCAGFSAPILPAKKRAVESKRFPAVDGEQLVPADASEFALGRGRLLRRRQPFDQSDRRHLRIGDDSHAADAGNVRRRKMNRAAELTHARDGGVHVVDGDIPNPALRAAALLDLFRQVHHPAHRRLADLEKRVGVARRRGALRTPAHDVRVEGPGGLHVGREQLVPAKPTVGVGHGRWCFITH
jgi:hypothetical protein